MIKTSHSFLIISVTSLLMIQIVHSIGNMANSANNRKSLTSRPHRLVDRYSSLIRMSSLQSFCRSGRLIWFHIARFHYQLIPFISVDVDIHPAQNVYSACTHFLYSFIPGLRRSDLFLLFPIPVSITLFTIPSGSFFVMWPYQFSRLFSSFIMVGSCLIVFPICEFLTRIIFCFSRYFSENMSKLFNFITNGLFRSATSLSRRCNPKKTLKLTR